ncbi:transcription factor Jun-like [Centruroides vittatus]|uniref:transcription factor AP-1-like n=1 Tax=Centruroides sculpturatus TaxID=218467 RepID=UPI000C6DEAD6|nr:transcription factor AP-1-like [Centruroides sculpturatus]
MEPTFYEDQLRSIEDMRMMKRTLNLDFDNKSNKKQRYNTMLTSPDMHMLKLESPELEKLIIAQNGHVTTTPTPNQYNNLFVKSVTEEEEQYAKGFVDALAHLHQTTGPSAGSTVIQPVHEGLCDMNTAVTSSGCTILPTCPEVPMSQSCPVSQDCGVMYTGMPQVSVGCYSQPNEYIPSLTSIKEEPQTVPNLGVTPPLSPIDMEDQERIKLERKRLRNRIAASKCRRRKLERIAKLEDKVKELKIQNNELGAVANTLRDHICSLKQQVMDHVKNGCQIMVTSAYDMGTGRKNVCGL